MQDRILYTKPSITDLETRYAADAAANGWGDKCYDYIYRFEKQFREHIGTRFAIATSSCTGALHLGLAALGIGPGDEVILADTNWIATVAPVVHLGAKPIFVDVDAHSWCVAPVLVQRAITPNTKAIIATHLYGNLADMDALLAIGEAQGIPVIEDSAEAIGSVWKGGRRAGSMGLFGTYSFHGTKTVTCGEGGMFVTNDEALYETVLTLSNHGRARGQKKQFWPDMVGFKYKMSNIQASIGCAQMERIEVLTARKHEIFEHYVSALGGINGLSFNPEPTGTVNGAWMPTVVIDQALGIRREHMVDAFAKANIDARVFFHPLSSLPMFQPVLTNCNAYEIPERAINLPSYHDMTDTQIERVADVIKHLVNPQ
jgi:perosamine synthetase